MALAWLERLDFFKSKARTREIGTEQERVKGFRLTLGHAPDKHWTLIVGGVKKGDPATLKAILERLGVPATASLGTPKDGDDDRKAWRWPVERAAA